MFTLINLIIIIIKQLSLTRISSPMQTESNSNITQSAELNEDPKWIQAFSQVVFKTRALIRLQIDKLHVQDTIESLNQANYLLINNIFKTFQLARESKQMNENIEEEIKKCDKFIKLTQIRIIDAVQSIMKGFNLNVEEKNLEQLYQQFYIQCSQYMNKQYDYSNKLCMLLSQEAQVLSKVSTGLMPFNIDMMPDQTSDSSLLRVLQQKLSSIKKNYENEILIRQRQVIKYQTQIQSYKNDIKNLINERDELIEDVSELQESIQRGAFEQAKQIIQYINSNKKESLKWKQKDRGLERTSLASEAVKKQIQELEMKNIKISEEYQNLKKKLEDYKTEIHRSAWIISVQSRQIMLNEQKIKEYEASFKDKQSLNLKISVASSNLSFNPNSTLAKNHLGILQTDSGTNIENNIGPMSSKHALKRTRYEQQNSTGFDKVFSKIKTPVKFSYKNEM